MLPYRFSVAYQNQTIEFTSRDVLKMFQHETQEPETVPILGDIQWHHRVNWWMSIKSNQEDIAKRILAWREQTRPWPLKEHRGTLPEQLGS